MKNPITIAAFTPTEDPTPIRNYLRPAHFWLQMSAIDLDSGCEIACARFYGTDATTSCVLWARDSVQDVYARGHGKAGGGGYHRPSAALDVAIDRAGLRLTESIHGVGDEAMSDALRAIAAHLGHKRVLIHKAHA